MLTPGYALTATERVLPRMALDFTTASLDPRVTVTRALNTATRVNSSGYVEVVNANLPRFDFSPTSVGVCNGLLIEEARINTSTYSETFDDASWTKTNTTIDDDSYTSPANTLTADKLIEGAAGLGSVNHQISKSVTFAATTAYSDTFFVRPAGRTWVYIQYSTAPFGTSTRAWFDLANGVPGSATNCTATIRAYPDGWYRIGISATSTVGGAGVALLGMTTANATTAYTGDGVSGVHLWGAQLEVGAFPTSYIPNLATGTTTRNADDVGMTGTNFSSWYNATEGALQTISTPIYSSPITVGATLLLDGNNFMATYFGDVNKPRMLVRNATVFDVNTTASTAQSSPFNQCFAYKNGSISFASNATLIVNSVNKPIPTPTELRIGNYPSLNQYANAWFSKVSYWPQRLINNEVIAFSK